MAHTDLAHAAALVGAAGCVGALLARSRLGVLAGIVALTLAELGFGIALVPSHDLHRLVATPIHIAALLVAARLRRPRRSRVRPLPGRRARLPARHGAVPHLGDARLDARDAAAAALRRARGGGARLPLDDLPRRARPRPATAARVPERRSCSGSTPSRCSGARTCAPEASSSRRSSSRSQRSSPSSAGRSCRAWIPRALAITLVAEAGFFALFGLWEEATKHVYFSRFLEVSNAYTTYYRTNSLFYDPNIYGRHLVLAMAVVAVLMWRRAVSFWLAAPAIVVLFVGLFFSYSQSSLASLFLVVLAITLVAGDRSTRRIVVVGAVACLIVGSLLVVASGRGHSVRHLTSDRSHLITLTLNTIKTHPGVRRRRRLAAVCRRVRQRLGARGEEERLAHDAADRRGGDRRGRLRRLPRLARRLRAHAARGVATRTDGRARARGDVLRPLHALALLQRLLRRSGHVGRPGVRRRVRRRGRARARGASYPGAVLRLRAPPDRRDPAGDRRGGRPRRARLRALAPLPPSLARRDHQPGEERDGGHAEHAGRSRRRSSTARRSSAGTSSAGTRRARSRGRTSTSASRASRSGRSGCTT